MTPAEIQAMFDRPPTADEEKAAQIRAEIDTLDQIDMRPMLVLQRLEIERLRSRIDAALLCYDWRSELYTNDAALTGSMVDALRGTA